MSKAKQNIDSKIGHVDDQYIELQKEIEALVKKVEELEIEKTKLELVLQDNGIKEVNVTDSEIICVRQIRMLKEKAEFQELTESQVKIFDILYRNLRILRGQEVPNQKGAKQAKKMTTAELTKLVKGS